jgi:peptidoglycan hydrolase CwlO-like protein
MDRPTVEGYTGPMGEKKHRSDVRLPLVFRAVFVVILWVGLVYTGYYLVFQQVERSVRDVQEANSLNVKALESRLDALDAEVQKIVISLSSADRTLSSSGSTQKELNDKIQKLDSQLKELERSLKILKEAPNAPR